MKLRLVGLLAVCIALIGGCGTQQSHLSQSEGKGVSTVQPNAKIRTAPNFTLATLDGASKMELQNELGHRWILLNVWASWCPPCQQEAPALEKMSKTDGSKVEFIGVNMTSDDSNLSAVKKFVSKYGLTFPILMDPKGTFASAYKVIALPTTYLISPSGDIVAEHPGGVTQAWLEGILQQQGVV